MYVSTEVLISTGNYGSKGFVVGPYMHKVVTFFRGRNGERKISEVNANSYFARIDGLKSEEQHRNP